MTWIVELLDARIRDELESLPSDMKARFRRIYLEGPLWEMRMKRQGGISRAIYVTAKGRRVVVVRVFVKKTHQTPRQEIDLALKRAKEVNER